MIILNSVKKAVKWYLDLAAKTYAWSPTGIIPYVRIDEESEEK